MARKLTAWEKVLQAITAPLGFFVLALLIVESFLGALVIRANLSTELEIWALKAGVYMFVFVVILVWVLVWFKPENLTFDKDAHLSRGPHGPFGTDQKPVRDVDELQPPSEARAERK